MTGKDDSTGISALVLSGGGAFGAYEVGVIQALYSAGCPSTAGVALDPGVFVGTSVGNFNAAILAMDNQGGPQASVNHLRDIWINRIADNGDGRGNGVYRIRGGIHHYLDPRIPGSPLEQMGRFLNDTRILGNFAIRGLQKMLTGEGQILHRAASVIDISLLLDVEPFRRLVESLIDPYTLLHSKKNLCVAATNWSTGEAEPYEFRDHIGSNAQAWDAIRASAAIPCLFPPVWMLNNYFIDGGVVMNTPIKPAIDNCADELHVISLDPSIPELPGAYADNTWDAFNRVYTAMVDARITADIALAKAVNDGISVMERVEAGEHVTGSDGKRFVATADLIYRKLNATGKLPRKLTIHRYYPKKPLGGLLGMLNFDRSAIDEMIAQGYDEACNHDCRHNGCVIPKT